MISIVVPIYNAERYLTECINSLVNQSFSEIEVILINDGSIDRSWEICQQLMKKDNRISAYSIMNKGVSNARNIGIQNAKGDYIIFIDADDYVENNMVEILFHEMIINKSDMVMCGYNKFIDQDQKPLDSTNYICQPFKGDVKKFLLNSLDYFYPPLIQSPCWKLFRKDLIYDNNIRFNVDMNLGEDTDFVLSYLKKCRNIVCIDACLYNYRVHGDDTLSTRFRQDKIEMYVSMATKYRELEEEILSYSTKNYDVIISNSFISLMNELINTKKKIPKKTFNDISRKILGNKVFLNSFLNISNYSMKYRVLSYLLMLNNLFIVIMYFELINIKKKWRIK